MNILIYLLVLLNTIGIVYLTYLFYRKNPPKTKNLDLKNNQKNYQIGLTKFNPFDDLGGEHSFVLSMVDSQGSGVVITSLHSRDVTRVYAKPIKNGQGDNVSLSKEEKSAIFKTIKG